MSSLYVMNAPIITAYGEFKYFPYTVQDARNLLKNRFGGFISAVGHESTAKFMSQILGVEIPMNRISVKMVSGDTALIFRLTDRLPDGQVLTLEQMQSVRYEIGMLLMR